jgi:hypothetical protein
MRTTIDLPDPLYRRAKSTAASRGMKLKEFIQSALLLALNDPSSPTTTAEIQEKHQRLMREHFARMEAGRHPHESVSAITRESLYDRHV